MNNIPVLYERKEDCCGCGACLNICPKHAISMKEDECGFIYPVIDETKCVRCNACKKVCAFQNSVLNHNPVKCYAAISKNKTQAQKSASAGIFAAIAEIFIKNGGIVFGAAFTSDWGVHHESVSNLDELVQLQGSKYAHSDTERTFSEAKEYLDSGKKVLYSGTPCQIDALLRYLGRDYDNLVTIDIVCHGVPSSKMLKDYLKLLENKYKGKIRKFTFRDKQIGWGINGSIVINSKKMKIWQSASSYLYYFSKGWLYRENCYKCKYANMHRPADLTIGDYWGIEKQHPELFNCDEWNEANGISLIIVNNKKGKSLLESVKTITAKESSFSKIAQKNGQLIQPSEKGQRDVIIKQYYLNGWISIERLFNKTIGVRKYSSQVKSIIPQRIKRIVKRF